MLPKTILSILLTITLAAAAPINTVIEDQPEGHVPNQVQQDHIDRIKSAEIMANDRLANMRDVLRAAKEGDEMSQQRVETAFGRNAHQHVDKILENVEKMQQGTVKIKSAIPGQEDKGFFGQSVVAQHPNGDNVLDHNGHLTYEHVKLGSVFHDKGFSNDDRAGTLIHEAAHVLTGANDDVVGPKRSPANLQVALDKGTKGIQINNPDHTLGPNARIWEEEGYAHVLDKNRKGWTKPALHADINPNVGAALKGTDYEAMINGVENPHANADSYRVFASLCARSLYKRAIMRDDPVGYYLAKREECKLPPDYFAKKAAAKKAAADAAADAAAAGTTPAKTPAQAAAMKGSPPAKGLASAKTGVTAFGKTPKSTPQQAKGVARPKADATSTGKTPKSTKATKPVNAAKGKGIKAASTRTQASQKIVKPSTSKTVGVSKAVGGKAAGAGAPKIALKPKVQQKVPNVAPKSVKATPKVAPKPVQVPAIKKGGKN